MTKASKGLCATFTPSDRPEQMKRFGGPTAKTFFLAGTKHSFDRFKFR